MKIPDDVLLDEPDIWSLCWRDGSDFTPDEARALVSRIVENSIDYEALALALAKDWDPVLDDAMGAPEEHSEYLKLAHRYAAALGIGDTDE